MGMIYIIEDDTAFAQALSKIVSTEHDVRVFDSVPETLSDFSAASPDLLFLDCMLPGESGPEFVKRLRENSDTSDLAIILMSAHHEMMNEANSVGGDRVEFLKKPCTMRQILAVMHKYLPA
jgi:DNA-binding response OmpR family regulator